MKFPVALCLGLMALAGCATVPKPLQGDFQSSSPKEDVPLEGARVRWGGSILAVEPKPGLTCFQILAHDLSDSARPRKSDESSGRFLACRNGFYDPAIFAIGRELTVTGNLSGSETRKIGEFDYHLPRVAADTIYLWPERPLEVRYDSPFFYHDAFWFGYYRPVIIHHHHRHTDRH
jgi:outer membrane lipoprotein